MAYKNSGFKMKNPVLMKAAKTSSPMQMNYKSPAKKMDPMYNGVPGVQKADFAQFSKKSPVEYGGMTHEMRLAGKKKDNFYHQN